MKKTHLTPSLYQTAKDIVNIKSLDYIGIMIACLEDDGALPIYAHYIDPDVADENWIKSWEEKLSHFLEKPVSLSDPETARVYINNIKYENNLGVKAVHKESYVIDDDLFSLFSPILPNWAKLFVQRVQKLAGIKQVVSVPFFSAQEAEGKRTVLGNFFAVKKSRVTNNDIQILEGFGRLLATILELENLIGRRRIKVEYDEPKSKLGGSFPPEQIVIPPQDLKAIICDHFSMDELKEVCFEFKVDFENLQGTAKKAKVIELIQYAERFDLYIELLDLVCKKRPRACEEWNSLN